jgi:putative sterol carrier protein
VDAGSASDLIWNMPHVFRADKAKGERAVIQFKLSGEGGGNYWIEIKDGACTVHEGLNSAPGGTVMMAGKDFVALMTGKLGGMRAFLTGKVKTSGDFTLLTKMQAWFPQ